MDKFAVLTGTITLTNGSGSTNINYPPGFTEDNCVVISIGMDIMTNNVFSYSSASTTVFEARLTTNNIGVRSVATDGVGSSTTKNFKIVLMKIN